LIVFWWGGTVEGDCAIVVATLPVIPSTISTAGFQQRSWSSPLAVSPYGVFVYAGAGGVFHRGR
jgi:hypothetical protein